MAFTYTTNTKNKRGNGDDSEEIKLPLIDVGEKRPYRTYEQTYSVQHTHFYLSKPIGEPDSYADMIHRIATAGAQDVIFIHLNTPGGQLDTGVQLVNAMKNSEATIVTILESTAYSLGTLIFLSGDQMVVNEHCMMMFHNFNGGIAGKGNELVSELEATVKWFAALAKDIYVPFLTPDEFDRIVRGEDMWMQTPEIKKRLDRMVKALAKQRSAEEKAERQAMEGEIDKLVQQRTKRKRASTPEPTAS